MAAQEGESLESLLTKATNPLNKEEDWDFILAFCDQINKELEGPQIAVRLLAHKIQSPQEKEALFSLSTLEACVKNCGRRFHQEIGKFRFLNEIIKVVSPKYLGNHTTERVKKKCIELLYSWSQGLPGEGKVCEAYQMLKRQGIVKIDPTYIDKFSKTLVQPPPPRHGTTLFEDDEKSKLLARLLKSKHPEDLQAANRLIKNMVKMDADRMEKVSKRVQQIETVNNNMKVLSEMLQHYRPGSASDAEKDLMKELYENLEKARPNLFRLASDTDEKDTDGINDILKANDEVLAMMNKYKIFVEGTGPALSQQKSAFSDLLDLEGPHASEESSQYNSEFSDFQPPTYVCQRKFDDDGLGLIDMQDDESRSQGQSVVSQLNQNDMDLLNDIFASSTDTSSGSSDIKLLNLGGPTTVSMMPNLFSTSQPSNNIASINWDSSLTSPANNSNNVFNSHSKTPAFSADPFGGIIQAPMSTNNFMAPASSIQNSQSNNQQGDAGIDSLNQLGMSLMKQTLSTVPATSIPVTIPKTQPLKLNQMTSKPVNTPAPPILDSHSIPALISPLPTPPSSVTASPIRVPQKAVEVQPLTDISVPLESVQPGSHQPISAYDKNNIKAIVHIAKNQPRPDVSVMVLSIMSTNTSSIRNLSFQAAVPKVMKVKLQPPSGTELPGFNPILPPTAVTQVMLIANPLKEKIRLKFKMSYSMDGKMTSDVGEVDTFPVQ